MITLGTNGYIELSDFKAWADARAYDYSGYTDTQIEAAITVSGVDFIDTTYRFKGSPVSDSQPMQLPTDQVAIVDIKNGAAQAAWQQLQGLLLVAQTAASANGQVIRQMDKLDVLETETEYAEGTQRTTTYNTTLLSRMLAPYTVAGGANDGMIRV